MFGSRLFDWLLVVEYSHGRGKLYIVSRRQRTTEPAVIGFAEHRHYSACTLRVFITFPESYRMRLFHTSRLRRRALHHHIAVLISSLRLDATLLPILTTELVLVPTPKLL